MLGPLLHGTPHPRHWRHSCFLRVTVLFSRIRSRSGRGSACFVRCSWRTEIHDRTMHNVRIWMVRRRELSFTFCLRLWHSVQEMTILFRFRGGLRGLVDRGMGSVAGSMTNGQCSRVAYNTFNSHAFSDMIRIEAGQVKIFWCLFSRFHFLPSRWLTLGVVKYSLIRT